MGYDSKLPIEQLNNKIIDYKLSKHIQHVDFMYMFGVIRNSNHYINIPRRENPLQEYVTKFKPLWDVDAWIAITWGGDPNLSYDENVKANEESDLSEYDYMISRAVEFNRPAWGFFGILGMLQGQYNNNAHKVAGYEIITIEDVQRCYNYLPQEFLNKYKEDLEQLFNHFDERGCQLTIKQEKKILTPVFSEI